MIPAPFEYVRARNVDDALEELSSGEDVKLLAGGHSLLPLMKLRLATPERLVDIGRISELRYVREEGSELAIGALTTHHTLETDPLVAERAPLLRQVAGEIGDPQVRHRGTIGGSVAHSDPAADLPAALLALDATYVVTGANGTRQVPAADFTAGFLQTTLEPDEVLTEVRVPAGPGPSSFIKFRTRAIDWAIVAVAALAADDGTRVALVNMGSTPLRARAVEAALADGASAADAAALAAQDTEPPSDSSATTEFRAHLARVLVGRALEQLAGAVR